MKLTDLVEGIVDSLMDIADDSVHPRRVELIKAVIRDVQEDQAPHIAYGLCGPSDTSELPQ